MKQSIRIDFTGLVSAFAESRRILRCPILASDQSVAEMRTKSGLSRSNPCERRPDNFERQT